MKMVMGIRHETLPRSEELWNLQNGAGRYLHVQSWGDRVVGTTELDREQARTLIETVFDVLADAQVASIYDRDTSETESLSRSAA